MDKHLLENYRPNFCDVVLIAKDGEVHAHKVVLALRSPVFAAMFEHDMGEKLKNRVEITDIECEVLQEFVRFIYTRQAPSMDDKMASGLLAAADKYDVQELKTICEESLSSNLTSEKVIYLIPLASLHSAKHLKGNLIEFIKLNDANVSILLDMLISCHPEHAVEAFRGSSALEEREQ